MPFTDWAATEPFTLILSMVTVPVVAIALGICITILANAFR